MAYCTVDDVQAIIPTTLWDKAAATNPSAATVTNEYIPAVDAEIDSRLASRYQTPITGSVSLALLEGIAARMAALRVWGTFFTGQTGDTTHPKDWDEGGRKLLAAIVAEKAHLTDAGSVGVGSASDPGAPAMTMRTIAADPLQDVEMTPQFSPRERF